MRWLFHALHARDLSWGSDDRYRPASLEREGFVHGSFRDVVRESARLYFPAGSDLRVLAIDPRRLDVPVVVADTPRGPMPHVHGAIPRDAVRVLSLDEVDGHADRVTGTRFALCAFAGMTLLDLVGPLDVLSRIGSMGFDPTSSCRVIALTRAEPDRAGEVVVWRGSAMTMLAEAYRPPLDDVDVLVVPGGPSVRALADDPEVARYLASFPHSRLLAAVCTGSLLVGAAGRLHGKRATTHATALDQLSKYGAIPVRERVVDEGQIVTCGGVTSGIDLALHLVERLEGADVARAIAERIELRRG
ncbi:MAG: DUF952 domain-containing protein [Labilithrix sp.]|nr:DUF952 domain-containing protein [Labilithrix sp.]